ncbi:MAG TPA: serine hydrolase domain-containing protein [Steroidobacteraceae bacterium]|jgi:CubicO group peptidase (beta-lactamase class C family)|nr:serine hydrolase domain-containing protein [Steroidobacteraceae bacterium]
MRCRSNFVRALLEDLMSRYQGSVPGAGLLVLDAGMPAVRQAYGMADLEQARAATTATNYRLASVTKQFTAAAVLMLAEEPALSLDAPVSTWLPQLSAPAGEATVRQLLTHTSGLIDYEDLIPPDRCLPLQDADVLTLLAAEPRLYFPAGSAYRYSNGGYALLALVVQAVSGRSFATFLRERLFTPLGMSGTAAHQEGISSVTERAYGYTQIGGRWKRTDQDLTSAVLGDGGVYSSIDDLAKWAAALDEGRLLRPESWRLAFTAVTPTADPAVRYGYGWRITADTVWHSGESVGFRNVIVRWPKQRLTVVILTNRNEPEPYPFALALGRALLSPSG